MARFKSVTNIWSTIKELDVKEIREQAEQPLQIAVVGAAQGPRDMVVNLLRHAVYRYKQIEPDPLYVLPVPLPREQIGDLQSADLLALVLPGDQALTQADYVAYEKLTVFDPPLVLIVVGSKALPSANSNGAGPDWRDVPTIFLADLADAEATRTTLAEGLIEVLPSQVHIAAARRLPGLRAVVARELNNDAALSNATYSFTSGLPEMIPVLNLPLNAADMLVLTKNQALLAYKIGLAMGASSDFTQMIKEVLPVIGSGFMWRQLARQLVGLIPGIGLLPKVAVSYAGTYVTGVVATRWYGHGEVVSHKALKALMQEALTEGRERAQALFRREQPLIESAESADAQRPGLLRRAWKRVRNVLPGGADDSDETTA